MPTWNYDLDIPFEDNNPSVDQPRMRQNTNSIDGLLNEDHYSFETDNFDGWHKKCTFPAPVTPAAPTGDAAVVSTRAGTASTRPDFVYQNSNATFPVSIIRAAASFTLPAANGTFPINNGFNIVNSEFTRIGSLNYQLILQNNVVTGDNVIVVTGISSSANLNPRYSFSNPSLSIVLNNFIVGTRVSVVVLQV